MFVIIDVRNSTDNYCAFGETLEDAVNMWKEDSDGAPDLLNTNEVMIIEGMHKIPKISYVNAPKKATVKVKK